MLSSHILIIVTLPNLLLTDRIQSKKPPPAVTFFILLLLPLSRREKPKKLEKFLCNFYCCGSRRKWSLKTNVLIDFNKNVHLWCTSKKLFFFFLFWMDILFIKLIIWQADRHGRPNQMFSALFQSSYFEIGRRTLHTYRKSALHDNCMSLKEQEEMD